MSNFFDSELCKGGNACSRCRHGRDYRRGIVASFSDPTEVDFECPYGKTAEDFPLKIGPGIVEMGKGLFSSIGKEIKNKVAGKDNKLPSITEEEKNRRISICKDCENFRHSRCIKCGCVVKYKARLSTGSCPIGKW